MNVENTKKTFMFVIPVVIILLLSVVTPGFVRAEEVNIEENDYTARDPIRIDGNSDFAAQAADEGWPGDGSEGDPYVIEGYEIDGTGYGSGIYVGNTTVHFVVRGCYVHNASGHPYNWYRRNTGLFLRHVQNGKLEDNTIISNDHRGIFLRFSDNNIISNNVIVSNHRGGIRIDQSNNNTISNNICTNNRRGISISESRNNSLVNNTMNNNSILLYGFVLEHFNTHNIGTSNLVNGKPVYYLKDTSGGTVPEDAGQVILVNCTGVTVENQNLNNVSYGISVFFSNNNSISNNNIFVLNDGFGISMRRSNNNSISDNNIFVLNDGFGISMRRSYGNIITNNNINSPDTNLGYKGISIFNSHYNTISYNNISRFHIGVFIEIYEGFESCNDDNEVHNNTFSGNEKNIDIAFVVNEYPPENDDKDKWLLPVRGSILIVVILVLIIATVIYASFGLKKKYVREGRRKEIDEYKNRKEGYKER